MLLWHAYKKVCTGVKKELKISRSAIIKNFAERFW